MFKQSVSLVEFPILYNILHEINDLFSFNIFNYQSSQEFLQEIDSNNVECINSTIILSKQNNILSSTIFSKSDERKKTILSWVKTSSPLSFTYFCSNNKNEKNV